MFVFLLVMAREIITGRSLQIWIRLVDVLVNYAHLQNLFCTLKLNRTGPLFKLESDLLQTFMHGLEFEPGTCCPAASALTTRQAVGQISICILFKTRYQLKTCIEHC